MTAPPIVPPAAIAVIGLGNMGVPMGACLIKAGFAVTGSTCPNRAGEVCGGRRALRYRPAQAVASADVVITLLPNGKIVRQAIDGFRAQPQARRDPVRDELSGPIGTRQLGEDLIGAGFPFVDAPVSAGSSAR